MTAIHRKVLQAQQGELKTVVARLASGWVVCADTQPVPGYCLFLSDPVMPDMNALSEEQRTSYWLDVCRVGDALLKVAGADRINYETWGNVDRALHTHITPRYLWEPEDLRKKTPREAYDLQTARPFDLGVDGDLILKLKGALSASLYQPRGG